MTKVLPCYSLCPLIEQNSFLGIAADAEPDTAVVTTNSNIIGRYRISEPKEIGSWNSKGSISCGAVYDRGDRQYVAIFNGNEIRKWSGAEKRIDKAKKFKFTEKLHALCVAPESGRTVVIFEKGRVAYLNDALDVRKSVVSASWMREGERISSFDVVSLASRQIAVLLVQQQPDELRIVGIAVDDSANSPLFDVPVQQHSQNGSLCGHCMVVDKSCFFVSVWSDGRVYRDRVYPNPTAVPANAVATLDDVKAEQPLVVKALSAYDVAVCSSQDDGLLLLVLSVKYNAIQCRQLYEKCSTRPQLWCVDSKLFLIMGHNLVVVPYAQENRKLSTLIGSNDRSECGCDRSQLPEAKICADSLSELLERDEVQEIREMLVSGYDVPDSVLLSTLMWSLQDVDSRGDIFDTVLNEYCASVNDVSELRAVCSVDQSLFVLEHIMSNLSSNENNYKLLKWASLFVDAFYQQYVMSEDDSVLNKLNEYVTSLTREEDYLNEFMQLASVLSCVQRKKPILTT